jgi:hypothetical protein
LLHTDPNQSGAEDDARASRRDEKRRSSHELLRLRPSGDAG